MTRNNHFLGDLERCRTLDNRVEGAEWCERCWRYKLEQEKCDQFKKSSIYMVRKGNELVAKRVYR